MIELEEQAEDKAVVELAEISRKNPDHITGDIFAADI